MPIDLDIRDHETIGPMIIEAEQKALQKGLQNGLQKGRQEGRQEGELTILHRLIEKRFGALPGWAREKLMALPASDLEDLSVRVLDATSVEDLLR
jgi:predicted transposase YdaD